MNWSERQQTRNRLRAFLSTKFQEVSGPKRKKYKQPVPRPRRDEVKEKDEDEMT